MATTLPLHLNLTHTDTFANMQHHRGKKVATIGTHSTGGEIYVGYKLRGLSGLLDRLYQASYRTYTNHKRVRDIFSQSQILLRVVVHSKWLKEETIKFWQSHAGM